MRLNTISDGPLTVLTLPDGSVIYGTILGEPSDVFNEWFTTRREALMSLLGWYSYLRKGYANQTLKWTDVEHEHWAQAQLEKEVAP